jgi:tripartite-type tricarboxylate transporter receptor subunit TctC
MTVRFRRLVQGAALALATMALAGPVAAQDWPSRNVTVIVPLAAGSASDVLARVVLDQVGRQLGQAFVIENRTGAGGTIGANIVAKAVSNGYTMLAYGALAAANALYAKLPYDTLNDFIPVIVFGQQPLAVITSPSKYKTLGELIAFGKANPGKLNFSSAGVGSATHFAAERLRVSAGLQAQHVPFKGAQESLTEIMTGRIDFSVQTSTSTLPFIRQGKIVALAVSARKRSVALPNVPTVVEAGLGPESIYPFYSAVYLPAKTPRAIVEKLHGEAAKALEVPAVREKLAAMSVEPMPMSLDEFGRFFRDDLAANLALAKAANLKIQ